MSEEKKPPRAQIFRYFRYESRINNKRRPLWQSLKNKTGVVEK